MIRNLQALRGLAAVLIFYHHFGFNSAVTESFGDFGVTFFMMTSGFVLMRAYGARNMGVMGFMRSRIVKIYPTYLLCWVAALLFLPYRGSREGMLLGVAMLQSWVPESDVYFAGNGVAWFVSDLMFCYLVFFPMLRLRRRWPRGCVAATAFFFAAYFAAVSAVPARLVHAVIYINPLMQLASFVAGMCLSIIVDRIGGLCGWRGLALEIAGVAMCAVGVWLYPMADPRLSLASYWWLPVGLTLTGFTLADADERNPVNRFLHSRVLQMSGSLSLCFYLIHYLGIKAWHAAIGAASVIPMSVQAVMLLVLLSVPSYLLQRYYAEPARRLLDRVWK